MILDPAKHRKLIDFAHAKCLEIPRRKKHCSIILHKNKIVAVGINRFKTHPLAVKHGYLFGEVHSELDAFLKCEKRDGLELWNFRFNTLGEMRISRPCPKCLPWCMKVFDNIYYTMNDGIHEFNMDQFRDIASS
jgi:hypothetical protein